MIICNAQSVRTNIGSGGSPEGHDLGENPSAVISGVRIVGVSSGRYNTIVLDDSGALHVWGYDGCADGTLPEQSSAWKARRVKGDLGSSKVVAFDTGGG